MPEVTCHEVGEQRIAEALEDIWGQAFDHWHGLRYRRLSLQRLQTMCDELLDNVAARTLEEDPTLSAAPSRVVLRTAAECALGALGLGAFPDGDFKIPFPLINQTLSSEDFGSTDLDQAPTARTWLDAFAICLISGAIWEKDRVIGLLLRSDYAPAIRDGVPYSTLESHSDPAGLAEMDALCRYLTEAPGHLPGDWPAVTLRKPDVEERAEAARRLSALGELTPDQQLLRVLLEDDQPAFERALDGRLVQHRGSGAADAAPRSLLPAGTIALAALAVQVHGWELGISSGYLPEGMLRAPEGAPQPGV